MYCGNASDTGTTLVSQTMSRKRYLDIKRFFLKSVMSSRVDHRTAEVQAGLFDLSFLYGLKNGSKRDVIDFCMQMDLIAKEYVCPACDEKMELIECSTLEDGFIWCCSKYGQNAHHIKRSVRKGSW
ncbi:hypothetical protein AVEN_245423-1 [Araneus ventricosus]|uniref:Uncharacterized protein n=1 Tax=Araneus ventricosus TaxID=182803 RepID=A0A4Y2QTD7_ARAVE|nr:hypothetical protein AVEN_245423-1 [Araneus ventricosus]